MALSAAQQSAEYNQIALASAALRQNPSLHTLEYIWHWATEPGAAEALPPEFETAIRAIDDESLVSIFGQAANEEEKARGPLRWVQLIVKREVERRLTERRAARSPHNPRPWDLPPKLKIPHPSVEVLNAVEQGEYKIDADQIHEALRGLPDDEINAILIIEPERQVSKYGLSETQLAAIKVALQDLRPNPNYCGVDSELRSLLEMETIEASVKVRNTSTLIAWCRANEGSVRVNMIAAAIQRPTNGVKTTLKPKAVVKRADPIVVAAINGAA